MSDAVVIVPELAFRQQVHELAIHLSRSIPNADQTIAREFVGQFENQTKPDDEETDISDERKKGAVRSLVEKVVELRGGIEVAKEADAESSHLSLQHLLTTTLEGEEYEQSVSKVVESVKKGGEAAATAGRAGRAEAACRVLNNTYNYLPPTSPLRPQTLLALLTVLSKSSDLSSLPITASLLAEALAIWSIPQSAKISFLQTASQIYQSSNKLSQAADIQLLAVKESPSKEVVERAVILSIATPERYSLAEVLRVDGVSGNVEGTMKELVDLFTGVDEIEAVSKGVEWVKANDSWIQGFSISQFNSETVLRKLRLIALAALFTRASSKTLKYSEAAEALQIDESDVEAWVIEAIESNILKARLSQPTSQIRIISVSSTAGTRRFGKDEWQLLQKRLEEWKKAVGDARAVVEEAEGLAREGGGGYQRRVGAQGQGQGQVAREEVMA